MIGGRGDSHLFCARQRGHSHTPPAANTTDLIHNGSFILARSLACLAYITRPQRACAKTVRRLVLGQNEVSTSGILIAIELMS
jgi:hypothetical protein